MTSNSQAEPHMNLLDTQGADVQRTHALLRALSSKWLTRYFPGFALLAMYVALFYVFTVVPNEVTMGAVHRIFYFHVSSAFSSYLALAALLGGSAAFLVTREMEWDSLAEAGGAVALMFASIVLASGMIWGHSAWNAWWRWEPRLVSFLVLWLILLGYTVFRAVSAPSEATARLSAVLGIIAAVNVPIVIYSIELLEQTQQLHPKVVSNQGLRDIRFRIGFGLATLALLALTVWLVAVRSRLAILKRAILEAEAGREDSYSSIGV